jgi:hypothetical protein
MLLRVGLACLMNDRHDLRSPPCLSSSDRPNRIENIHRGFDHEITNIAVLLDQDIVTKSETTLLTKKTPLIAIQAALK